MGKRTEGHFIKLPRKIFSDGYAGLSIYAKWLYVVLNELDSRFTGKDKDRFFRSNEDLARDAGISVSSLKRAQKELLGRGLIRKTYAHWWQDENKTKLSKKKVTCYRIT